MDPLTWNAILKRAVSLVIKAAYAAIVIGVVYSIYYVGKHVERNEWTEKWAKRDADLAKEIGASMQRVADDTHQKHLALNGALNERDKENENLRLSLAAIKSGPGLFITAPRPRACPKPAGVPAPDPEGKPDQEERIELPKQVTADLRSLAADAQQDVIDFNALAAVCSKGAVILP